MQLIVQFTQFTVFGHETSNLKSTITIMMPAQMLIYNGISTKSHQIPLSVSAISTAWFHFPKTQQSMPWDHLGKSHDMHARCVG